MTTSDNISAIEAIEKAMEAATPGVWDVWEEQTPNKADAIAEMAYQVENSDPFVEVVYLLNADGECPATTGCGPTSAANAAYISACSPDRMRLILAEARKAEAMELDRKREAQLATDMASDCLDEQKRREAAEARVAALENALQFVALWAWREDPPNANSKLTDAERLSVIKHHPTVKSFYETDARALLSKESADAQE